MINPYTQRPTGPINPFATPPPADRPVLAQAPRSNLLAKALAESSLRGGSIRGPIELGGRLAQVLAGQVASTREERSEQAGLAEMVQALNAPGADQASVLIGSGDPEFMKLGIGMRSKGSGSATPYTDYGKIGADLLRGLIDQGQADTAYAGLQRSDENDFWEFLPEDQAASLGLGPGAWQRNRATGEVKQVFEPDSAGGVWADPPKDHAWKRDAGGTVELDERGAPIAIPVGPALEAQKAAEVEAQAKIEAEHERAGAALEGAVAKAATMLSAISGIREIAGSAQTPFAGTLSRPFALYTGTPAGKVRAHVNTLKSGVALQAMVRLKEASKTGATGFGQMNRAELQLLIDEMGALEPGTTDPEIFMQTIGRIEARFTRVMDDVRLNVSPEKLEELGLSELIGVEPAAPAPDPLNDALQQRGAAPYEEPGFSRPDLGLPPGVTEEDIQHTMQLHGLTRQQVLERLGAQ